MRHFILSLFFLLSTSQIEAQKLVTTTDIWYSPTFSMDYVGGFRSMNDGLHYSSLEQDGSVASIVMYSYATGDKVSVVMDESSLPEGAHIDDYSFSADEKKMLIASGQASIYRHSSNADYYIYEKGSRECSALTDIKKGKSRLAEFSPDGSKVAFVRENDLYMVDLASGNEKRITEDGKMNHIINGATDWVYEEEFAFDKGFYWSPDSKHIAFYRFDESKVKEFQMAMYHGDLYPSQYTFKYPKAGEQNSDVSIHIYTIAAGTTQKVDMGTAEHYVPRIKWTNQEGKLCVTRMNRHQNHIELLIADMRAARGPIITPQVIYSEKSKTYIEVSDDLIFLNDGKQFLLTSDKDGYNHIYLHDMKGTQMKQVTSGKWDVIEFFGYDELGKKLFYSSSEEGAIEKNVYSIDLKGSKRRLSPKKGSNDAEFSVGYKNYIIFHSDANSPYDITLYSDKGKELRVLVDNDPLKKTMGSFDFQPKEFFTFTTERGDMLNGWTIKPKDMDPSVRYPVLVAIYGGPGHNTVTNSFDGRNYYWHQMLAQKGYIVVSVDPRGTYYRGRDFKNSTYLQLGKLETEDMISAAKYLGGLPYVDRDRIGMQGWSFGGYLTSSCMTKGAEYFKAGIAVAPVTNWRFYDTIYTERFMQTPEENPSGYDENSPINHVEMLKGPYLLVHGSADDNVHYQNTMEMVDALVKANKDFDLFIYPDKNHGIYGGTTRLHLYEKMTKFIEENL
jgi:dipeptidyl-peptidase-4